MIKNRSGNFRELLLKGDLFAIAAALLMALAVYFFLQTLVEGLIAPAIAALFSEPGLYALSFTVNGAEFGYGSVLSALILLGLVVGLVAALSRARQGFDSRSTET